MSFLRKINYRILVIGIIILLQAAWGMVLLLRLVDYSQWISLLFFLFTILVVLSLNMKEENASYKVGWIILIMAFPLFGGVFYLLFGNKRPTKPMRNALAQEEQQLLPYINSNLSEEDIKLDKRSRAIGHYVEKVSHYPLYNDSKSDYYKLGEDLFEEMIRALEGAEKYIFLEYFIVEDGLMWQRMLDILKKKAALGLDVRMIYDDVGSMFLLPADFVQQMETMGIKCLAFNKFKPLFSLVMNHRNHRKMLIIDGQIGFTGGINIADEYINKKERFGHWKDTGLKIQGRAVWSFTLMFVQMWNAFRKDRIDIERLYEEKNYEEKFQGQEYLQPFSDTPLDKEALGENIYIEILAQATDYVYIFTPYLIIDSELQSALQQAAKRGVDVRIVTPGIPDKKLIFRVTRSYYPPLLNAGVKIYEYSPGFLHAKSYLSDDKIAMVGTINMDYRSLYLHFECGVLIYGGPSLDQLKEDKLETFAQSREISLEELELNLMSRIFNSILRLFSVLM